MSLPHLIVTGTHYEVGQRVGSEFKSRIQRYIRELDGFDNTILPYIQTNVGERIINGYTQMISDNFPWYYDELKGIAEGSEVDLKLILAINYRVELYHLTDNQNCHTLNNVKQNLGCTDIFLVNESFNGFTHNEDSNPVVHETGYIVTCKIKSVEYNNGRKSPEENFTCYCYPGHLPGNAFFFTSSGLAVAVNALYPKKIVLNKYPRQLLTRLLLNAKNLVEMEDLILKTPISYALSINVGYFGDDLSKTISSMNSELPSSSNSNVITESNHIISTSFNYEITSSADPSDQLNVVSKLSIVNEKASGRIKLDEQVAHLIESSLHRIKRLNELPSPNHLDELLALAFDTHGPRFPIFRTPNEHDGARTVAVAVFDLKEKKMKIFLDKPKAGYEPFLTISMN